MAREKFNHIVKRGLKRWGKVLTGRKLDTEDISKIEVLANVESDADYVYTVERNEPGNWDLKFFERGFFGGRSCEQEVLKNVTLEECLDWLYRHQPPYMHGGKLMLPCDLRRVAAMIDYVPPPDAKGSWDAETKVIERTRERSMDKRRERAQEDIAELRRVLGKDQPKP